MTLILENENIMNKLCGFFYKVIWQQNAAAYLKLRHFVVFVNVDRYSSSLGFP